jgi:hypothetical protein
MRVVSLLALSTVALAAASPGSHAQTLTCYGTQRPKQVAELLFGRDVGNRLGVSETAWSRFVAHEMTPRFPDGLIVTDAVGQWHDTIHGTIMGEPSKRVEIVLPGGDDDEARLDAIVKAYKDEFHQQSVGVIVRPACVAF